MLQIRAGVRVHLVKSAQIGKVGLGQHETHVNPLSKERTISNVFGVLWARAHLFGRVVV